LIAGGETTVTIKGNGKGGRNQEFALAALRYFKNEKNITIFSAGSDGTDGPTNAAGAIVSSTVYENAVALGLNINAFLSDNDSYHFFEKAEVIYLQAPHKLM
jgi:glycerate-2-kinase